MVGLKPSLQILKGKGVRKRGVIYVMRRFILALSRLGLIWLFHYFPWTTKYNIIRSLKLAQEVTMSG
jgi:hypothetical protein